ncbi:hypothetical protein F383_29380 [Gossypium arboreum]|uniref:Uncharacterized protein n=3 Tax=Gossypium TaxID=3633 RepID=A0A0B0MXC5_GOSAR|nr:hypothetical protein F383_29380 [Gossypium arboreum]TYG92946.1 hypothetical protein ES288_A11G072400v1 [Gossypium darwinii]TYH99531.1 hypothetical protein ES332_A11G072600v1 [Gossypium tomentosum]
MLFFLFFTSVSAAPAFHHFVKERSSEYEPDHGGRYLFIFASPHIEVLFLL